MTLRLPKFDYIGARTLQEAVDALEESGPRAMVVAGGTDLFPNMKRRQFTPEVLVGLRQIPELHGISHLDGRGATPPLPLGEDGGVPPSRPSALSPRSSLRIGACVSLTAVATHPAVLARFPALATAAGLVSTPQLRNMGTIGGNICLDTRCNWYNQSPLWRKAIGYCMKLPASGPSLLGGRGEGEGDVPCRVAASSPTCLATFSADTVPALVGYDASIRLVGPKGERSAPLRNFYQMDGIRWMKMEPGEVLADVTVPDPDGLRAVYLKLRDRGSFDFPLAGVFVGVRTDAAGLVDRARIVLTGVYSMPVELTEASNAVLGQRLEPDAIAAAADAAYAASRPVDNTGGAIIQRRRTIRVFVRRALEELVAGVARGGSANG
jgi:4-hydroxybenzoyl-CoA reductase subunit beta